MLFICFLRRDENSDPWEPGNSLPYTQIWLWLGLFSNPLFRHTWKLLLSWRGGSSPDWPIRFQKRDLSQCFCRHPDDKHLVSYSSPAVLEALFQELCCVTSNPCKSPKRVLSHSTGEETEYCCEVTQLCWSHFFLLSVSTLMGTWGHTSHPLRFINNHSRRSWAARSLLIGGSWCVAEGKLPGNCICPSGSEPWNLVLEPPEPAGEFWNFRNFVRWY